MTVRWGFLGAGGIATNALGPAVQAADGVVLQAAGARDVARAERLGPVRAYGSYDEVLADPDVDAVYIALHNDAHRLWTLAALEAGKHVLCEKPLGTDVAEVEEMTAAAERAGRLLVEASWYRWHPRTRAAAARLAEIGPVTHVAAGFTFDGVPEGDYRLDPARGGGALYDVGCYAVSAALWAVGRGLPDEVAAQLEIGPTGVDLDARVVLDWDGATAEVRAGIASGDGQWLVITGERGEVELRGAAFANWHEPSELWVSDGTGTERVAFDAVDPYRLMVEEVSAAVEGRAGWLLPLEESRQNAAVLAAAFASGRDGGRPVAPQTGPRTGRSSTAGVKMLTVPEVAERMGLDVVHVRTMVKDGALLAVRDEQNRLVVPERQLDGAVQVKHLVPVLTLLRDAGYDVDEALEWLSTPDPTLPGSPFDALHENRATEVKRRAQALG